MTDTPEQYVGKLLDSFTFFIREIWEDRGLDEVAPLGEVELDILEYTQNGPANRGILAPRSMGKTHLVTCGYAAWRLMRDPDCKVLIVSRSESEAKKTVHILRRWIAMVPFLQHLRPQSMGGQRDTAVMFDVGGAKPDRTPSVTAKGVDGQLEGCRAHLVLPDDVETRKNTKTVNARAELDERVKEFAAILYPDGEVIYVGTFHHEESVYIKLSDRGYNFRTWTLQYPAADEEQLSLAPMLRKRLDDGSAIPGEPTMPHRFPQRYIDAKKAEGRTHYAMQYQLIANLGDTLQYPLVLRDLIVMTIHRDKAPLSVMWGVKTGNNTSTQVQDIASLGFAGDCLYSPVQFDNEWHPYTLTRMWIDPSGKGADSTGYAIVAHLNGILFVKAVGGLAGGYDDETLDKLSRLARTHDAREITVESNFGQDMFAALLEPHIRRVADEDSGQYEAPDVPDDDAAAYRETPHSPWTASIHTSRATEQKEIRIIDALEPVMNQHRLVVDPSVIRDQKLQYQMTRVTKQRNCLDHDDELESLAMCVWQWQESLHQDPRLSAERLRERMIDKALNDFRRGTGQEVKPEPRWFQHKAEAVKY